LVICVDGNECHNALASCEALSSHFLSVLRERTGISMPHIWFVWVKDIYILREVSDTNHEGQKATYHISWKRLPEWTLFYLRATGKRKARKTSNLPLNSEQADYSANVNKHRYGINILDCVSWITLHANFQRPEI